MNELTPQENNLNYETNKIIIADSGSYLFIKRMFDVFTSIFGLILLSPLFLVLAILIKIDDPKGPVLFKQKRIGKNEVEFNILKFRSMVSDAEKKLEDLLDKNEVNGAMFKIKEDPRVTKIGKFIRKTSIDELPQLINVIRGEMSLVGPRPPLPREVKEYSSYHKQRLLVIPGCTGVWQVSGRNSLDFEDMVNLDLDYIVSRSLSKDLWIIIRTILILIKPNAAY